MTVEQMEQARAWLERDSVLHANMLEVLRRGSADALIAEERGVLLHDTGCGAWMLAAEPEAAEALLGTEGPDLEEAAAVRADGVFRDFEIRGTLR